MRFQVEVRQLAESGRTIAGGQDCNLVCANAASHGHGPLSAAFKHLAHELRTRFVLPMPCEVKCKALWRKSVHPLRPISQRAGEKREKQSLSS
jgi:hypothetical protein